MKRATMSRGRKSLKPRMAHNTKIGRSVGGRKATLPATGTKMRRKGATTKRRKN